MSHYGSRQPPSRKDIKNREKTFRIEKTFQNREDYFKIQKNVSQLRNILLQESRKKLEFNNLEFNEPSS